MTDHTPTNSSKKPAFLAYDVQPWSGEAAEAEAVGVTFPHRDAKGFDVLLDGVPLSGKLMLRKPDAATTGVTSLLGGVPAKKPDYLAYVVRDGKGDRKGFFRKIGFGYRHADGEGIDLLYKAIPANGRIVLRTNDEK